MKRAASMSIADDMPPLSASISPSSQTLVRGLDVLELVAGGPVALAALAGRLGLARSTAHRLATALVERRYLTVVPRQGYGLGPKLLELGSQAQEQTDLVRLAHPYLSALATETRDTAFLCVPEGAGGGHALVLERVPGRRRLVSSFSIGERLKLTETAAGMALLLDEQEDRLHTLLDADCGSAASRAAFIDRQHRFAALGYTFDAADAADNVRAVCAPVRGADAAILGTLGISSATQYLADERLAEIAPLVCDAANRLGNELGRRLMRYPARDAGEGDQEQLLQHPLPAKGDQAGGGGAGVDHGLPGNGGYERGGTSRRRDQPARIALALSEGLESDSKHVHDQSTEKSGKRADGMRVRPDTGPDLAGGTRGAAGPNGSLPASRMPQ
jgi:DNA-binding IclR family transcriptional regulator